MRKLSTQIKKFLYKHKSVFQNKLGSGRRMDTEKVEIRIDKKIKKPRECHRPRPVPTHWRTEAKGILDQLLVGRMIKPLEASEGFLSPSFHIAKPHN